MGGEDEIAMEMSQFLTVIGLLVTLSLAYLRRSREIEKRLTKLETKSENVRSDSR